MKQLFNLFILLFVIGQVVQAQSSKAVDANYFVQEKIGSQFNHMSIENDGVSIFFHNDRIEMISEVEGDEQYFFIMMKNVTFNGPIGVDQIKSEIVPIESASMAKVLKVNSKERILYSSIKYVDNVTGNELLINLNENKINFEGSSDLPLELQLWGNAGPSSNRSQGIQLEEFGKIIELSSNNRQLTKDQNKISFNQIGGLNNTNLNLTIAIN